MKALNEQDLSQISGGRILYAAGMLGSDINNPWEIVDNRTGQTLYKYNCKEAAIVDAVKKWGGNDYNDVKDISQNEVMQLRAAAGIVQ